jgi:transcriptional regulator with XRE-family HTH domain
MSAPKSELLHRVGLKLRALREERAMTKEDVAERSGFTGKYISEIERGQRDVPISTLERIVVRGLGSRVERLFGLPADAALERPRSDRALRLADAIDALPSPARRRVLGIIAEALELAKV